jgi:5-methylcytosine-specific restriction endonuclease McrA
MTNAYDSSRGNPTDRQRRKLWLLETYRADRDVLTEIGGRDIGWDRYGILACEIGSGQIACRCYRCGRLLTYETLTVDRIVPGCVKTKKYPKGGTYCRENIRPSCSDCATKTGNALRAEQTRAKRVATRKAYMP